LSLATICLQMVHSNTDASHASYSESVKAMRGLMHHLCCHLEALGLYIHSTGYMCSQVALWPARMQYVIAGPNNLSLAVDLLSIKTSGQPVRDAGRILPSLPRVSCTTPTCN